MLQLIMVKIHVKEKKALVRHIYKACKNVSICENLKPMITHCITDEQILTLCENI